MPNCKLVTMTRPLPGREAEYNDWYQNTHIPELVNTLKMKGAQRFKLVAKMMGASEAEYLAIYDIECDDPADFMHQMGEASASGKFTKSNDGDQSATYASLFVEYDERVEPA